MDAVLTLAPAATAVVPTWGAVTLGVLVCTVVVLAAVVLRQRGGLRRTAQEADRLRELARRRADQVSVLSHEIRTPLALIKGSADLLEEETPGPLTPVQKRFVSTISASSAELIALAEDLLTQARIEAGLFELHPRRVELRSFLRSVVADLRLVHQREIALDTPGPPVRVTLDPQLISQLVGNLVANSLRHSPDSTHPVVIRAHVVDGHVVLAVSDSGLGMTAQQRDRLFGRFQSSAPIGQGTGIGLYISRHIAELHGGSIHVDTIADRGTTMILTLPAAARRPPYPPGHARHERPDAPQPGGIDD